MTAIGKNGKVNGETVWKEHDGMIRPFVIDHDTGKEVMAVWDWQPGSQEAFGKCRDYVYEVLYEGERGPGKTVALLMDFSQEVGRGFGISWRGLLLRRTFPELRDAINKSKEWFPQMWPAAKYNGSEHCWTWPTGEILYFGHFLDIDDYWNYHGHEYPWIGWEELTSWPSKDGYTKMMSLCRCASNANVPRRIRATTNPYGVGHGWVKERFRLPLTPGRIVGDVIDDEVDQEGELVKPRVAIHGCLTENRVLMHVQPDYLQTLRTAASSDAEYQAWIHGNWDIVAGGMFDDVWNPIFNVVPPFSVPRSWRIDRSFDWGSSRPFSVAWWAESDGSDLRFRDGRTMATVRGDTFRILEWYGWTGKANKGLKMKSTDITAGIVEREIKAGLRNRVYPGPADTSIFTVENGNCIAQDMAKPVRVDGRMKRGVTWTKADKSPGSRVPGWILMREMMENAHRTDKPRENPGLFVVDICTQFRRTVPVLTRDEKNMDDVDDKAEDHIADDTRYRLRKGGRHAKSGHAIGSF